jgi:hypothetical protein
LIFDYPVPRLHRRHGPDGYSRYESYRPWLRDEFTFRCVYCLKRESWGQITGEFDIDHFQPQQIRPDLAVHYENLVYACARCNAVKRDILVDDPFVVMSQSHLEILPDGTVQGHDEAARRLILKLDLNSPRLVEWRTMWLRIVELARERDLPLFRRLVGYPNDLPRLESLRPPGGNARPEGLDESWSVRAKRGELPDYY